jgi:hypothetical protein
VPDEFDRFLQDVSEGVKRVVVAIGPGKNDDSKFHEVAAPWNIWGTPILAQQSPSDASTQEKREMLTQGRRVRGEIAEKRKTFVPKGVR